MMALPNSQYDKPINKILSRLQRVKANRPGQWQALCPVHDDKRASLTITEESDGKVLMYCHAGCAPAEVLAAIGLELKDLFPGGKEKQSGREVIATYDYYDQDGVLSYQVLRKEGKGFVQRRPDGSGGWIWKMKGIKPLPYKLPELTEALRNGVMIFVVEGEKDVNNLSALGLTATTNHGGAGKWRESHSSYFPKGCKVVVLPDNDDPGRGHAQKVARSLNERGCNVRILELPDLPEKGDVTDWLKAGRQRDELLALVDEAFAVEPEPQEWSGANEDFLMPEPKKKSTPLFDLNYTDLGNARRFVKLHGENLRYSHEAKNWYIWTDKRWEPDKTGRVKLRAKDVPREMYSKAAAMDDEDAREALIKHALRTENEGRLKAMVSLAQSEPGIPITVDQFDADPFLLNCRNGVIDLRTGELMEHRRGDYMTRLAPVIYRQGAQSEIWDRFLERIIPNPEVRAFVQRFAGYSISGSVGEEVLAFPFGPPATGKSTFLRAIAAALGDYAATADFDAFLVNKNQGGPRNDIARLAGKRFVVSVEVEDGRRLAEGLVNQITGGDTVTARFLYQESFEFVPQFKLWLAANNRPKITGTDGAIWRRILQIPFFEQIPVNERDPGLKTVLCDIEKTGPAILAWLVEGCLAWQREGLNPPEVVRQTTEDYKQEMDPLTDFIEEKCILAPAAQVENTAIWQAYRAWVLENSERCPLGRKKFSQSLMARGLDQYRDGVKRIWIGIGLAYEFAPLDTS